MYRIGPKVLCWASILESQAREQIEKIANLSFVPDHVAALADCHFGKGSTIGSVIPTERALIPSAVGVDIGCGVCATKTTLMQGDLDNLTLLRTAIERAVPRGEGKRGGYGDNDDLTETAGMAIRRLEEFMPGTLDPDALHPKWQAQLGTLGGGNHFIELDRGSDGHVWVTLHSGSRGIGANIANFHIKTALKLMKAYYIQLENPDLAYLPEHTRECDAYVSELDWAQTYAYLNRQEMMIRVLEAIRQHLQTEIGTLAAFDVHHNYAVKEHHLGRNLWITRKGAVRARVGDISIIPGSMGTPSYIVKGKGNIPSYHSAPHGAGRQMSRRKAKEHLSLAEMQELMAGIESSFGEGTLDEAPGAYKPIEQVIADSADLIDVEDMLSPILNIKGG